MHSDASSVESMCKPHIKEITEYVTGLLLKDPEMATAIVSRIGYEPSKFLKKYLHFALPYAVIYTQDQDALLGLCNALDQTPADLVRQGAIDIAIDILIEQDHAIQRAGDKRLIEICRQKDIMDEFVMINRSSIMAIVAMNLGHPTLGQSYHHVMMAIHGTINGNQLELSSLLDEFFMPISENVLSYIHQVRNHSLDVQHPYALESLKIVMSLLEENITNHNRHVSHVAAAAAAALLPCSLTCVYGVADEDFQQRAGAAWHAIASAFLVEDVP